MSTKEAYVGLVAEEIAGMVAATIYLDTVVRTKHDGSVVAFGGMGGDKGYPLNSHVTKLFSVSTLAAVVLSADGSVHNTIRIRIHRKSPDKVQLRHLVPDPIFIHQRRSREFLQIPIY